MAEPETGKRRRRAKAKPEKVADETPECFLIMPISDSAGYESGHFQRVRDQIFRPACDAAGYKAVRADDGKATNVIHIDMLKRLIETPMALCDLSSRNPNVLFELGIRQAFDKPVVIVQEEGTERIFDVSLIRVLDYKKKLLYQDVLDDQTAIAEALRQTRDAPKGEVNSLIRLLSLSAAKLDEGASGDVQGMFQLLLAEVSNLKLQSPRHRNIAEAMELLELQNPHPLVRLKRMDGNVRTAIHSIKAGIYLDPNITSLLIEDMKVLLTHDEKSRELAMNAFERLRLEIPQSEIAKTLKNFLGFN